MSSDTHDVMSPRCQQLGQLAQEEGPDGRVLGVVHHVHVDHVHWRLADRVPGVETFQNLIIRRVTLVASVIIILT